MIKQSLELPKTLIILLLFNNSFVQLFSPFLETLDKTV